MIVLTTLAISPIVMGAHSSEEKVSIPPYSYAAVRFKVNGFGLIAFSVTTPSSQSSSLVLLEMTEKDFDNFASRSPYETLDYAVLTPGWTVKWSESVVVWVRYIVIENESSRTATLTVRYSLISIFNILLAVPISLLGVLVFVIMVLSRKRL